MKTQFNIIFLGLQCGFYPTDIALRALLSVKISVIYYAPSIHNTHKKDTIITIR